MPDWGQLENEQKLPKMVHVISNFIVLDFGENFMKNPTKNSKITDVSLILLSY